MNEKFSKLGFYPSDILLPKKDVDMSKWAVVACDQFTSEPEYWERVEKTVGDAPSTLRLILPEANLKAPNVDEYIADINASMSKYLEEGIFETLKDSLIYIERGQSDGKIRHGLIGMVDLDQYDFTPGSGALIRVTVSRSTFCWKKRTATFRRRHPAMRWTRPRYSSASPRKDANTACSCSWHHNARVSCPRRFSASAPISWFTASRTPTIFLRFGR